MKTTRKKYMEKKSWLTKKQDSVSVCVAVVVWPLISSVVATKMCRSDNKFLQDR